MKPSRRDFIGVILASLASLGLKRKQAPDEIELGPYKTGSIDLDLNAMAQEHHGTRILYRGIKSANLNPGWSVRVSE